MPRTATCLLPLALILSACGGLPQATKAAFQGAVTNCERRLATVETDAMAIEQALKEDPATWARSVTAWRESVATARHKRTEAETLLTRGKDLVTKDRHEERVEVEVCAAEATELSQWAHQRMSEIATAVREVKQLKASLGARLAEIRRKAESVTERDLTRSEARFEQAAKDWPAKKGELERLWGDVGGRKAEVERLLATIDEQVERPSADIDWVFLRDQMAAIDGLAADVAQAEEEFLAKCDQLYVSWEEILVDMELKEGAEVTFHHKLKRTTNIAPKDDGQPQHEVKERWQTVTEGTYKQHERHLGMALRQKEPGTFDHEAKEVPQPPGYSYLARRGHRNRYGYWERDRWHWNRHYSYMGPLYWGRSYRPIGYDEYDDYHRHRRSGRTWFGLSDGGASRFGSGGTATKTQYQDTRYTRASGFSNTRYKQSGGTYKGSRYSSPSSTNRTSSSGSSYRSSGGSSGGGSYRSSGYSGSRSSGGK